jgi:hypothetical protein
VCIHVTALRQFELLDIILIPVVSERKAARVSRRDDRGWN